MGVENMKFKRVTKLILGMFIISSLFNVFGSQINTEDPPIKFQRTYMDSRLVK